MTIAEPGIASPPDLSKISDTDWQIADARYAAIRPLLETERCTATKVAQQAQQVGVRMVTFCIAGSTASKRQGNVRRYCLTTRMAVVAKAG